jgi:hypothetical protein
MQKALLVSALVLPLALFAGSAMAGQCTSSGTVVNVLVSHGLGVDGTPFIPFPAGVPTPGGNTATGLYYDDRASGTVGPIGSPLGFAAGDGTWIYLETNGIAGLQRGGHSSLPTTPLTGENDNEIGACVQPTPDELIF